MRIPSLDGLRAISIAMVICGHLCGTSGFPFAVTETAAAFANFGVRIFFVISGFLITSLLLREQERTGRISLKDFYIRRAYRILPASYTYTLFAVALFWSNFHWVDITAALLYFSNFLAHRPWQVAHLWSLSVEEQFYLLWPGLLAVSFPRRRIFAVLALIFAPLCRVILWYQVSPQASGMYFFGVMDALATGCLLSMVRDSLPDRLMTSRWPLLIAVATTLLAGYRVGGRLQTFVGITFLNLGVAVALDHCIRRQYRLLNIGPVAWLGTLSYSLYLWQQPFINRSSSEWWNAFPLNLVLAFGAACICHYAIEKPALRLRERGREQRQPCPQGQDTVVLIAR